MMLQLQLRCISVAALAKGNCVAVANVATVVSINIVVVFNDTTVTVVNVAVVAVANDALH